MKRRLSIRGRTQTLRSTRSTRRLGHLCRKAPQSRMIRSSAKYGNSLMYGRGVQLHLCLQWVRDSLRLSLASRGIVVRNRRRSGSPLVNRYITRRKGFQTTVRDRSTRPSTSGCAAGVRPMATVSWVALRPRTHRLFQRHGQLHCDPHIPRRRGGFHAAADQEKRQACPSRTKRSIASCGPQLPAG